MQNIIAEHEIRNISCAAQDPEDLCTFAYITKDLQTSHHYCHVFSTVDVVRKHSALMRSSQTCTVTLRPFASASRLCSKTQPVDWSKVSTWWWGVSIFKISKHLFIKSKQKSWCLCGGWGVDLFSEVMVVSSTHSFPDCLPWPTKSLKPANPITSPMTSSCVS